MTLCVVTRHPCHCQPDEGIPCPEVEHLRAYQQQMNDILKENATLRNDLTACQLERDASQRAQREAEAETGRALAAHAIAVRDLTLERDRLQEEHRIWDKHSLVQIVEENERLKAEILSARRNGSIPEAFWLSAPQFPKPGDNNER